MRLIWDNIGLAYVWVDTDNDDVVLSPYFDTEEEAIQWYGRMAEIMFEEFGINSINVQKSPSNEL